MMQAAGTCLDLGNMLIHWLSIGAAVAGLIICILNRRLSKSMILIIVGFGGLIAASLLPQLIGAFYRLTSIGPEIGLVLNFFSMFVNLLGPLSLGLIVWGLFLVFKDMKRLKGGGDEEERPARRRRRDEDDD